MLTTRSTKTFYSTKYSSWLGGTVLQRQRSGESCAPSTTVRSLRELQWSPSPASRGRRVRAISFSQRDPRRSYVSGQLRIGESLFPIHHSPLAFVFPQKEEEAERRQTLIRILRILRCGSRLMTARSSDGVPPRLSPEGIIPSQRLGFRPGFLGRGLNGRYPPSPVPVQGSTSHPGRNAGRHDAQAARERTANPPASTAPAPPHGLPPEGVPW